MGWEKIFANNMTEKGLIFKIYVTAQHQRKNNLVKKCTEDLNKHFSKEDTEMANRQVERCWFRSQPLVPNLNWKRS